MLDAGPLIALLHALDPDHRTALSGFEQLLGSHARLIAPLPIVFEVYKWLLYEAHGSASRHGLQRMRESPEIVYPTSDDVDEVATILAQMPGWNGTLEDALVAVIGMKLGLPVWTLNYRDLSAFRGLAFWSPSPR